MPARVSLGRLSYPTREAADMIEPEGLQIHRVDEPRSEQTGDTAPSERPARNPLGPIIEIRRLRTPVGSRLYAGATAIAAAAIVVLAATISPAAEHMGSHRQLGLLPCGFLTITGLPCPTCGMTTAFAHTVHGHWLEAVRSQLAGFLIAIATALVGLSAAVGAVTGRYPAVNWYRVNPTRFVWWVAGVLVAAWAVKIATGLLDGSLPAR
jgi:Protein of unknown function (DUF2752)